MTALTNGARTNGAPKLKRSMGLWMATALVVGNMVGSGVFLLPATLAGAAGPVSLLGWVFTGTGAVLLALVFANLGREEVATAVIDGAHSAVWQQAANRLPTEQAVLYALVSGDWEV